MFYKNEEMTKFTFKKDKKLSDDTEINVGEEKITYNDIKNLYPINKDRPISLLVYWDDVVQYTSIALCEIICAIKNIKINFDFEHFFNRTNDFVYGMDYVYKLFEGIIKKEEIDEIKKKNYWKILELSLKTSIFGSLIRTSTFYHNISFYFPYRFSNCDQLLADLNKVFKCNNTGCVTFLYENEISFEEALKNFSYNSVITPNINKTYEYIIENNLKRISIIGPSEHNGLSIEVLNLIKQLKNFPKPNYCSVEFYLEQIYM